MLPCSEHRLFLPWLLLGSALSFKMVALLLPQVKCDHYWPFTEEPIAYGDITVEMVSEEEQEDWASRHFRINYVSFRQVQGGCSPSLHPTNTPPHKPSLGKTVSASGSVMLLPARDKGL